MRAVCDRGSDRRGDRLGGLRDDAAASAAGAGVASPAPDNGRGARARRRLRRSSSPAPAKTSARWRSAIWATAASAGGSPSSTTSTRCAPGQTVVIPLQGAQSVGVYANGYQTIPILCYHRFGPRPSQLNVTPAAFEAQMDYLARNGYNVLPLSRARGFPRGRRAHPAQVRGDHDRRRLPVDLRNRVPDPAGSTAFRRPCSCTAISSARPTR